MSLFARIVFALTSFAPAWLFAAPFMNAEQNIKAYFFAAGLALLFVFAEALRHLKRGLQILPLSAACVSKERDSTLIAVFMFAVLALFMALNGDWWLVGYLHGLMFLFVVCAKMPHINLLFITQGYKQYKVKTQEGAGVILLSRSDIIPSFTRLRCVLIEDGVYLHLPKEQ